MFEDSIYVGRNCPFCGEYHEVEVSEADYWNWQGGELVQNAFPYLNANAREILVSGICSECWDKMFGANFESVEENSEEEEDNCFEPGRPFTSMFELNP